MLGLLLALIFFGCDDPKVDSQGEPWPESQSVQPVNSVEAIPAPYGYERRNSIGEFGEWLRQISLKEEGTQVKLHNGELKYNQSVHARILDIDVGSRDLQQCADAVMRLRGEYLFQANNLEEIAFNYTSGDRITFSKWMAGNRPVVKGNNVGWQSCSSCDDSYESFRKYMDNIFMFAGTASLSKELNSKDIQDLLIGDVFIQGGFPGHAIIVMDMAENEEGEKIFLLAQSYMPAQDIHILKNFNNNEISPWYSVNEIGESLETPEFTFSATNLKGW